MDDIWEFSKAVVRHWIAGVTGGILAVAIMLSGTFHPVRQELIAAALVGYFAVATFMAWREQFHKASRLARPLDIRIRLDELASRGEHLLNSWLKGRHPRIRSIMWNNATLRFVQSHFTISQNDGFTGLELGPAPAIKIGMAVPHSKAPKDYEAAILLGTRIQGLRWLREKIKD